MSTAQSRVAPGQQSSHLPPLLTERPGCSSALGWCDPGLWPTCWGCCLPPGPALLSVVQMQSLIRAYKTNRLISEALAGLSGAISYHPHVQRVIPNSRADPALDLSNHQPFQQPVHAPLPGWCSLGVAVQPGNGMCLHRDLLPANTILLFSNKKFKKFTSLV